MDELRILLAEDQQLVREGLRVLLEQASRLKIVGMASDGEECVRLATQNDADVVLMNIGMPKMNGIQATIEIKRIKPKLPIIGLSGCDDDNYIFPMLDAGASGYILKSSSPSELIKALYAAYAGGTILDPKIAGKVLNRLRNKQLSKYGDHFEGLTEREINVLQTAATGKSSKEIGRALRISPYTVQAHMRNIFAKLEVGNRAEAVAYALRQGWISLES